MKDKKALTAPCGLDCFNCDIYEDNLTNDLAELISKKTGAHMEEIACKGCRQQDGKHFHLSSEGCATLNCAKANGLEMCCDCTDFPCVFLAPTADEAARYPHNMKVYNLCRTKKVGLDRWIEEEAGQIRKKYFTGKFVVGRGQAEAEHTPSDMKLG
ncbi:MAG TPA: hypothetical protein DCO77_10580 [Nitrospiraceae bacterium]|nr:hypothetical protein [Nitrospiraceae bacterium]